MTQTPSTEPAPPAAEDGRVRSGGRLRRFSGPLVVLLALGVVGGVYAVAAPSSRAASTADQSTAVREGRKLYEQTCISCHGRNAQGVLNRGPSLIGVGSAAVEFQMSTGRMPAVRQEAQAARKKSSYRPEQIDQIAAYIQSIGGGPQLPAGSNFHDGDLSNGGRLFRLNCASCHNFAGVGGALSSGKYAPSMKNATDQQIYAAMLTGPQNMPVFGDNQLTPKEKRDIITYVQTLKSEQDQGGFGLGRLGPVPEGLVVFVVGIVLLLFAALWIGAKS